MSSCWIWYFYCDGVRLSVCGTGLLMGPIVHLSDVTWTNTKQGRKDIHRGKSDRLGKKPVLSTVCPSQIPRALIWVWPCGWRKKIFFPNNLAEFAFATYLLLVVCSFRGYWIHWSLHRQSDTSRDRKIPMFLQPSRFSSSGNWSVPWLPVKISLKFMSSCKVSYVSSFE
jgi:hypothetical protein